MMPIQYNMSIFGQCYNVLISDVDFTFLIVATVYIDEFGKRKLKKFLRETIFM